MAIEAQGVQIRRQSTAAGSTATVTGAFIAFSSSGTSITSSDATATTDFVTLGFTTGMRLEQNSTANSTNVFTIASVAATVMGVHEPVTAQSTGASITLTAHSFDVIGTVTGFNGPSGSAAVIDVTSLGSTAKEKMIGIRDEGQLSLDIIYDSNATARHIALKDDRATRTRRIFDIKMTDQTTVAGSQPTAFYMDSYVTGFALTAAIDDVVKGSLTLEITSAVRTINKV